MFLTSCLVLATCPADDINYRVVVRFGSVCCGPFSDAYDYVYELVAAREKLMGKSLVKERKGWGEEGEYNLCLKLDELTASEQEEFVQELLVATTKPGTIQVAENVPCRSSWQ
ncbi:MAG: hypothetical protein ACRESK_00735 [Gammaproteobacteria bacterium]